MVRQPVTLLLLYNLRFQNDPVGLLKSSKSFPTSRLGSDRYSRCELRSSGRELSLSIPIIQIACNC